MSLESLSPVFVSRDRSDAGSFIDLIEAAGGTVRALGTIRTEPTGAWNELDRAFSHWPDIEMVIFTSRRAVELTEKRRQNVNASGIDWNAVTVIAAGKKTAAACAEYGIAVDAAPSRAGAEGILAVLGEAGGAETAGTGHPGAQDAGGGGKPAGTKHTRAHDTGVKLTGKIVLLPRSEAADDALPDALRDAGADVRIAPIYRPALPARSDVARIIHEIHAARPPCFAFTSPSALANFLALFDIDDGVSYFRDAVLAAIGPTTERALEESAGHVEIVAEERSLEGLARAIVDYAKRSAPQRQSAIRKDATNRNEMTDRRIRTKR